jgi:hypothetical protein
MTIYLYIKQCSHCNLKYFGKTIQDPFKYKGSGKHWRNHLKKHAAYPVNIELYSFESLEQANIFAISFSEENNIVKSKNWANEIIETALDGGVLGHVQSLETISKRVAKNKGKKRSPEQLNNLKNAASRRNNTNVGKNTARKISTPHGAFESLTKAASTLNVSIACISKKVNNKNHNLWYKI